MRPLVLAATLLLTGAAVAPLVTAATAGESVSMAPADRYFGRMRMSILGIRNRIADLARRADADPGSADSVEHDARLVEDALRDWQSKFPRDPWIPRMSYALGELYGKIGRPELAEALPGR